MTQLAGDCNQDGAQDVSDVLCSVGILFPGFSLLDRSTQTLCDSDGCSASASCQ